MAAPQPEPALHHGQGPGLHPITLRGRHVTLEPLRRDHVAELWAVQDERTWDYMVPPRPVRAPEDLGAWIDGRLAAVAADTALAFLLRDAAGRAAGATSLFDHERTWRRIEVGHTWVAPHARRTALNTEAKLLLLRHAFAAEGAGLGVNRVQFKCDARNVRSATAIERLGAKREGLLRNWMTLHDGFLRDTLIFSITRSEWPAVEAGLVAKLGR